MSASRIPSQKTLPTTTAQVSRVLYFTCMKNRTTSVALSTAIASATTVLNGAEIDERDLHGQVGADHQGREDQVVDARRNDVL